MTNSFTRLVPIIAGLLLIGAGCAQFFDFDKEKPPEDPGLTRAYYYLVALAGTDAYATAPRSTALGCDDRLVLQAADVKRQSDLTALEINLEALFDVSPEKAEAAGLYTPFGSYDVEVEVFEEDGKPVVNIVGDVISAGHCDDPRVRKAVQETARFTIGSIPEIRWNGSESAWRCLGDESGECR